MKKNLIRFTLLVGFTFLLGCGQKDPALNDSNQSVDELSPTSAGIVYAEGWDEIQMIANSAKTNVDNNGHFTTSRNACGKESFGALDTENFNKISRNMNLIGKQVLLKTPRCTPFPEGFKMDGTAEVKMTAGKKLVFETHGGEICSYASDPKASDELLAGLDAVVKAADKEDCPRGWGSG